MAPQTTGSRTHKSPGSGSSEGTMERPGEGGQVVERDQYSRLSTEEDEDDGRVQGESSREQGDEDHPGGVNTQQVGQVQVGVQVGGGRIGLRHSTSADSIVELHRHALDDESQQPLPLLVKDPPLRHHLHHPSSSSSSQHPQLRHHHHHHHHHNRHKHHHKHHQRHPHFLLQQQRPPRGSSHLMESRATLCSTLEQEQCLLEEGNNDSGISRQGAAAVAGILTGSGNTAATRSRPGSGSSASSSMASGSGAYGGGAAGTSRLTFGEVSVPESMLRTPLHKTDHKAYYSFVNPALVPSLTDFQMQTKGRDEWYLDSDGLAHLYEVPAANCIKAEMVPPARRAIKNLVVLSLAFMFVLTAFVSLQTLQSTMNHADGLGVVSLCCVYASTVFSCLLAPAVIKRLTTKWTLVMAFSLFLIYIGCNFYPIAPVVIPASVLLGLLTGPLWSAQSTYLTTLAIQYASANKQLQDTTINKFNGIFMSIVQTSQVWGNLVSTLVLSHDNVTASVNKALSQANLLQLQVVPSLQTPGVNGSGGTIGAIVSCSFRCGALDCGVHDYPDVEAMPGLPAIQHTVAHVPTNVRMLLLGVQLACAITGVVLVTSLLDRNSLNTTDSKYPGSLSSQQLFSATFKMFQDPRLQLLLPLVVFTGLEQGFVFGEFTKSYVNCALGIHKIGSVMMCFGAMTALTALFIGAISRHIKRFAIMTSGTLFNTGLLIVLLWWKPRHDDLPMFYVIASCLGLCDAIWQTQTNTLFGVLFAEKQEAGFASYRMFQAIGFAISFGYSYYLCVSTKVYIMTGVLLVSLLLYSVIEFRLYQQARTREGVVVL